VPARPPASPPGHGLLLRLSRLPRLVVPGAVLVLVVAGLAAPAWVGVPCLVVVAAFLGWLATVSWPVLESGGRTLRVLTVTLLLAAAAGRSFQVL
jgi:hypothetical protein